MNPVIPIEKLILFALILIPAAVWLAWKSAAAVSTPKRLLLSFLRLAGVLLLAVAAFNPGHRTVKHDENRSVWALLVDNSESMLTEDVDGRSRLDAANRLAQDALAASQDAAAVRKGTFSDRLRAVSDGYKTQEAAGGATDIAGSGRTLLAEYAGTRNLRGILMLSDGRQVAATESDVFVMHALAQNVPLYAVVQGGEIRQRDLSVRSLRREYVAFSGQPVRMDIKASAESLGAVITEVQLLDADQKTVASEKVELSDEVQNKTVTFEVADIPAGRHLYSCRVAVQDGEHLTWNNRDTFEVVVLKHAIATLHVEGLPYWDSKFLMQLLRRQPSMTVESIYRVGAGRFFKVESDITKSKQISGRVFPESIDELAKYDMVILGKGCEYVLTHAAITALREFVREHGGALIFSRGKPYHGNFPELEALEAGEWGSVVNSDLQFLPTSAGEDLGLFGRLLPGMDGEVWKSLPPITHAHRLKSLNSFSRVMAVGSESGSSRSAQIPLIVSRRYGKGMILTINADGIWQWGFMPSVKQADKMYNELWSQLLNWTITYSEFLPGENFSIDISDTTLEMGDSARIRVRHRPVAEAVAAPMVEILRDGISVSSSPLQVDSGDALSWDGILSFSEPGLYNIKIDDGSGSGPESTVTVLPQPDEHSNESADRKYLEHICRVSGGRLIKPEEVKQLVEEFEKTEPAAEDVETKWNPLWDNPLYLILLLLPFTLEWFVRRRNGLL
jgi:hypothetical protein